MEHDKLVETQRADQNYANWQSVKATHKRLQKEHERTKKINEAAAADWIVKENILTQNLSAVQEKLLEVGTENLQLTLQVEAAEFATQHIQEELAHCDDSIAAALPKIEQFENLTDFVNVLQNTLRDLQQTHQRLTEAHTQIQST